MPDIFISYAHEDEGRIQPLARALEDHGWSVFWDRRIPAGGTWQSHIGKALSDAKCVIVAWSSHSIDSSWVYEEADDGKQRGILIPLLLESVKAPIGFRTIQAADLTDWQPGRSFPRFEQLVDEIKSVLRRTPTQPPPEPPDKPKPDPITPEPPQGKNQKQPPIKITRRGKISVRRLIAIICLIGALVAIANWIIPSPSTPVRPVVPNPDKPTRSPLPPEPSARPRQSNETINVTVYIAKDGNRAQFSTIMNTLAGSRFKMMPAGFLNSQINRSEIRYCNPSNAEDAAALKSLLESRGSNRFQTVPIIACDIEANRNTLELWIGSSS
jgi:hypothetical protein